MATPNYMKRISFLDGQVLHDFHLNIMQKNIAEAIKLKTMTERYDMLLLISPYNFLFAEPFVNDANRDASSTATIDPFAFSINADTWIAPVLEIPTATSEFYLLTNYEDDPANGATLKYYLRASESDPWKEATTDKSIYMPVPTKYVQVKVECLYTGTVRPVLYDYCLMWK